jgi:glycine/D-amino acid oxidase-like deaminating enzyme/nitrite reductase/ring-hydroxylating ferredoxin subunit
VNNVSYWIASTPETAYPRLDGDVHVDAAVIGAGIVGVTTAYMLRRAGLTVALVEMDRIARGASGYTTAKVTSGHSLIYRELEKSHGSDVARSYARANEEGLALIRRIVEQEDLDCDLETKTNYVYAASEEEAKAIHEEVEAASRAGLSVREVAELDLPYSIAAAVALPDQAQFHPRKYLMALADRFVAAGGSIYEDTRVTDVVEDGVCRVATAHGELRAEHVVVATHYPFLDRALLFPRVHPKRSYAIAGPVEAARLPDGMFISSDQPTRSLRTIPDGSRTLLMVGGEGHDVGQDSDTEAHYRNLERWAGEQFGMTEVPYRWSTQDGVAVDHVPYIGTYHGSERVRIATAFGKWGFTNGTIGAQVMTDDIVEAPNEFASLYDPKRFPVKASASSFVQENAKVAARFAGDRVMHPQRGSIDALAPGEAVVEGGPLSPVAAYRDESGVLHKVSAVCTHLKCLVRWNNSERTWDCPCHGSRFDYEGRVIQGPAVEDLERID